MCRTYDYLEDSQKLKLFPSTLKGAALKCFMGLLTQSIRTWNDMKQTFLNRYLDYCMLTNHKDEVLKMVQKGDENLEDLLERFQYNLKRAKMSNLDEEILKALLLKAIRDEWIDILNMMGKGDISQLPLHDIGELCVHLSREKSKTRKGSRDPSLIRANKSATGSVSRAEIGNMLDEFKTDILGSLSEQLDTLKIHNKQKAEAEALAIYFSKCRKKHAIRECPLDAKVVETCVICSENHETKDCPSIPGLKAVFQEDQNTIESLCFVARRPWQGQQNQGFNNSMNFQTPPNWNPWQQPWSQPQNPFQSWINFYRCQKKSISEEDSLEANKGSEASLQNPSTQKEKENELTPTTPIVEQPASSSTPPFPKRLQTDKGVEKQILLPDYDFLDELKNVCIKIPLLQAIREIPILEKTIKELSLK
eukprot:PITA_04263